MVFGRFMTCKTFFPPRFACDFLFFGLSSGSFENMLHIFGF